MIFINDPLTEIVRKGELTDRYYNPGDLFDEIHLVLVNPDRPDPAPLQKMVGRARLHLHNLPLSRKLFVRSLGWRPWLLKSWAQPAVALAEKVKPSLIRCFGNTLNGIPALVIKKRLGVPYIVSLHTNPDVDPTRPEKNLRARILGKTTASVEKAVLRGADRVLPVYQPIIPYLRRLGVERYEVAYNVINPAHLRQKVSYSLHDPVRIISVGRQIPGKNPDQIIKAVARLAGAQLTLVGDGPLHEYLRGVAKESGASDRVVFHRAIANDKLCESLRDYDLFAAHTEYSEISKSVLEPLLTGLPVIINNRIGQPVPEFEGDFLLKVENTEEAYYAAIKRLMEDGALRESVGRKAFDHAAHNWSPLRTEENFVRIYNQVIQGAKASDY